MNVISKLLNDACVVPFNCYEVGHFWTPDCSDAALELFLVSFKESLKIYSPLYLASQIIFSRKYDRKSFQESFQSIIRSSAFLSTNAYTILLFFCIFRSFTNGFYYRIHSFFPTFFAAFASILIEKPSRRFPLAIYVANIASECLFRIYVDSGYIKPLPNGEVWLFTASMATLLYLIKQQGYGKDPVSMALQFYLGTAEAGRPLRHKGLTSPNPEVTSCTSEESGSSTPKSPRSTSSSPVFDDNSNLKNKKKVQVTLSLCDWLSHSKHHSCKHKDSCLWYSVNGFYKPFLASWVGYTLMGCARKYQKILKTPGFLAERLFSQRNVRFGLFFGSFSAIFKATSCLLRRYSNGNEDWHGLVAGLAAGPSMLLNPNSTITLYIFWKCIETLYWREVKSGRFSNPIMTANIVYSLSVAQIAFCLLLQPKHMRPSYMKFIDQITGHRFHMINRLPLNFLVPEAIHGYEDFFPDLNPKFMSHKFLESMFVWLI